MKTGMKTPLNLEFMKKTLTSPLAVLLLVTAVSCSKDDDNPKPTEPTAEEMLAGYWTGTYNLGGDELDRNYAMLFRTDGTVRVYNLNTATDTLDISPASTADGTYQVLGNTVTTSHTYSYYPSVYTTEADTDENFEFMQGNMSAYVEGVDISATFFLNKGADLTEDIN